MSTTEGPTRDSQARTVNVFQEIHDRSLWQVTGLYLGFSWIVLQVVQTMTEGLGLPEWVMPFALILLAIGLPIVLGTAFVQRGLRTRAGADAGGGPGESGEAGTSGPRVDPGAGDENLSSAARHMTWKRALLGGVAAAVLFAAVGGAWALMRDLGIGPAGTLVARGVLDERDLVLLADFENATEDPILGGVVTEALRVDLSQSDAVRIADRAFLSAALARMSLPPDTRITEALARDLGQREGIKALVAGDVARAGTGYSLTARVESPATGEILVSHRESASDSTELLAAIDDLSRRLRERMGDPLRSLAATPPLEKVTTANLEALRKFTESTRLPDAEVERSIQLLEDAVALDSTFAFAWRGLGIALRNYGSQPGRAMEATNRAFALRDRLTAFERDRVEAGYYAAVTREPRRAIPAYERAIARAPESVAPQINIGEVYRELGELDAAMDWYERALRLDSTQAIALMNVAQVSATRGEIDRSLEAADRLDRYGHQPFGDWHRAAAAAAVRDYAAAESRLAPVLEDVAGSGFLLGQVTAWQVAIVATRGRLAESMRLLDEARALQEELGVPVEVIRRAAQESLIRTIVLGEAARAPPDSALARYPLDGFDAVERPYLEVADVYAQMGDVEEASRYLEAFESSVPEAFARGLRFDREMAVGSIALAEGRHGDAIAAFRRSASRPQEIEPLVRLARAFDAAGARDSARIYYGRYVDATLWIAPFTDEFYLGVSLERLAELEGEAGNLEAAARHYGKFVELWEGADPELQPRVGRARARLEALFERIG